MAVSTIRNEQTRPRARSTLENFSLTFAGGLLLCAPDVFFFFFARAYTRLYLRIYSRVFVVNYDEGKMCF